MSIYADNYGHAIYEARVARTWTQEDLALQLGVSRQTVNRWENNAAEPSLEHATRLIELLRINSRELFNFDHPALKG